MAVAGSLGKTPLKIIGWTLVVLVIGLGVVLRFWPDVVPQGVASMACDYAKGREWMPESVCVPTGEAFRVDVGVRPADLTLGRDRDGRDGVWVVNAGPLDDPGPDSISQIDIASRRVVRTIATGDRPGGVTMGREGVVWFTDCVPAAPGERRCAEARLRALDPTDQPEGRVDEPRLVTDVSIGQVPLGSGPRDEAPPGGVVVDRRAGVVWTSNWGTNQVFRLDLADPDAAPLSVGSPADPDGFSVQIADVEQWAGTTWFAPGWKNAVSARLSAQGGMTALWWLDEADDGRQIRSDQKICIGGIPHSAESEPDRGLWITSGGDRRVYFLSGVEHADGRLNAGEGRLVRFGLDESPEDIDVASSGAAYVTQGRRVLRLLPPPAASDPDVVTAEVVLDLRRGSAAGVVASGGNDDSLIAASFQDGGDQGWVSFVRSPAATLATTPDIPVLTLRGDDLVERGSCDER